MAQTLTCPVCGHQQSNASHFCASCGSPLPGRGTGQLPPLSVLGQGRYRILTRVGMGGMGAVYKVADLRLAGALWAVKEMSDAALINPTERAEATAAFRREAQLLARLSHPNIPKVVDYFDENNKHYLVMEFVSGESLEERLAHQRTPCSEHDVRQWAEQLFDVLTYLHDQSPQIVFRDLKPDNIMLTPLGQIKLIDFGIARLFKPGRSSDTVAFGTPGFAAPEQWGRAQTDHRSDIYSLGVVLHRLLTLHDPASTPFQLPLVRQLQPSISVQMEQVIIRATQQNMHQRFQSVAEMRQMLSADTARSGRSVSSHTKAQPRFLGVPVWALVVAIVVVSAIGITIASRAALGSGIGWWGWITLGLIVLLAIIGGTLIAGSHWQGRLVKTGETQITSTPPKPVPPNSLSENKTISINSTDLRPVLDMWFDSDNREVIRNLIFQEDFESLKTWFARITRGRWLLTGYGRFGGTSLVRGAVAEATRELRGVGKRNVVFFYFEVKEHDNHAHEFVIEANGTYLGTLTQLADDGVYEDRVSRAQDAVVRPARTFHLSFTETTNRALNVETSSFGRAVQRRRYGLPELATDIESLTKRKKKRTDFQQVIARILDTNELPLQVVLIFDRIHNFQTLEELAHSGLFSSDKISVLAVARKEDVSSWQMGPKAVSNDRIRIPAVVRNVGMRSTEVGRDRPGQIDFRIWAIPCLWHTDYISSAISVLLGAPGNLTQAAERNLGVLRDHLAYVGRGSLGNVLEELRYDPWYWRHDDQGILLRLDPLPPSQAHKIRRNAWKQQVLTLNWTTIIPDFTETHPEYDRARLGVYFLMDWISENPTFTFEKLLAAAHDREITISDEEDILRQTVSCLVHVLREHNNLDLLEDGRYRTQWASVNLTEAHTVECPKAETVSTIVRKGASISRGEVHLNIIVEEDTSVSATQAQPTERSGTERMKIVAVFATPEGSDSGRLAMESRVIKECAKMCRPRNVDVVSIHGAKIRDLQLALLEQDPHIVHFSGHATESGELQFEDENGKMKTVDKGEMARLLGMISSIECVILNARHTLSQGEEIISGVPFTIAMDGPISHEISAYFVRGFYDAVASGKDYAAAYEFGLGTLGIEGFTTAKAVPKLLRQSSSAPQASNSVADPHS